MSTANQKHTAKKVTAKTAKKKSSELNAAEKNDLPNSSFAFPSERKEPLIDAQHVRNAVARFMQVEDVSDSERDRAWRRIKSAAEKFDVKISEGSWHDLSTKSKSRKS